LRFAVDSDSNVAIGASSMASFIGTTGEQNTAVGRASLDALTDGSFNVAIGAGAGSGFTTGDGNVYINPPVIAGAESNTLRIGFATGVGGSALAAAYVCGIEGVDVGSVAEVVTIDSDQLGSATITAGANIAVTPGANTITISSSAAQIATNYSVANATPFVVPADAYYITVDTSTIAITIQLPNAPTLYQIFVIKDSAGNASANNVTVTTVGGALNLDAATTFVMNTDWQSIQLLYDGFGYQIF